MKRILLIGRRIYLPACCIVLFSALFTSCLKKNDDTSTPLTAYSALMGFNLAPDKEAIGFSVSDNNISGSYLAYTNYTGTYISIFTGTRDVAAFDANSSSPFTTTTNTFVENKYYSVFTIGANGTYRNLVVNDKLDSLSAATGQAYIRFVNAIPDSSKPTVAITLNGTSVANANAAFGTVSDFIGTTPGDISIQLFNGSNISATRTFTVEKSKVYTILLMGIPGAADATKAVKISYIVNGTVS